MSDIKPLYMHDYGINWVHFYPFDKSESFRIHAFRDDSLKKFLKLSIPVPLTASYIHYQDYDYQYKRS